jgi:hypothetical protein
MRFGSRLRVAAVVAGEEEEEAAVKAMARVRVNLRHREKVNRRGNLHRKDRDKVSRRDSHHHRGRVSRRGNRLRRDKASLKDNLHRKDGRPRRHRKTRGVPHRRPVSKPVRRRTLQRKRTVSRRPDK